MKKHTIKPYIIYGMSLEKSKAERRIRGFSEEITSNIIKLCAYPDSRDYQHWIDELATWFADINDIDVKPKGKKFSSDVYDELIFGEFGTTLSDVRTCIDAWIIQNRKHKQYPEFEVTNELIRNVFMLVSELRDKFLKIFSSKNNADRKMILGFLMTIINR